LTYAGLIPAEKGSSITFKVHLRFADF
jgi:hypothetical protein